MDVEYAHANTVPDWRTLLGSNHITDPATKDVFDLSTLRLGDTYGGSRPAYHFKEGDGESFNQIVRIFRPDMAVYIYREAALSHRLGGINVFELDVMQPIDLELRFRRIAAKTPSALNALEGVAYARV